MRFFNFIKSQPLNKFWFRYFYILFIFQGNDDKKVDKVLDLRIEELVDEEVDKEVKGG